jgi:cephalosporin-C deacetylase-like acetyl esterase
MKLTFAAILILSSSGATAQSLEELRQLYRYDRAAPLNLQEKEVDSRGSYKVYAISYALPRGRMAGFLVAPDGRGRKPAIVWMHSGGSIQFLGDAVLMAKAGAVSLLVSEAEGLPGGSGERIRDQYVAAVIGLRRGADLLAARDDVDASRLALVGHSFGAMMCAVAISIDERFRAAVFEVGLLGMSIHIGTSPGEWAQGIRKELGAELPQFLQTISVVDAKHYIGHAPAIPKLFQAAWYDPGVPRTDAEDFFNAATGPKELKWYDSGHDADDIAAMADRSRFLGQKLRLNAIERVLREKVGHP